MSKDEGKTVPPGGFTDAQTANSLIDTTKQKFLLVNVCKGATRTQLIQAIEEALKTTDVPFFQERKATLQPESTGAATAEAVTPDTTPVEALLMLVRQEGW